VGEALSAPTTRPPRRINQKLGDVPRRQARGPAGVIQREPVDDRHRVAGASRPETIADADAVRPTEKASLLRATHIPDGWR
jgi:hypothetical protein